MTSETVIRVVNLRPFGRHLVLPCSLVSNRWNGTETGFPPEICTKCQNHPKSAVGTLPLLTVELDLQKLVAAPMSIYLVRWSSELEPER